MRSAAISGRRSSVAVMLSLWTLITVAACGPRDSREPTPRRAGSNPASLQDCQARVRCYDAIVKYQKAAVKRAHRVLSDRYRAELHDSNPELRSRATTGLKAARSQQIKLSTQLTSLMPANPPSTLRACAMSLMGLRQAVSLLKARHGSLVKEAVLLLARGLKDPDIKIRQAALVAIDNTKKELHRNRKDLNALDACKPFARHK